MDAIMVYRTPRDPTEAEREKMRIATACPPGECITVSEIVAGLEGLGVDRERAFQLVDIYSKDGGTEARGMIYLPGFDPFPWEPEQLLQLDDEPQQPPTLSETPTLDEVVGCAFRTIVAAGGDKEAFFRYISRFCPGVTIGQVIEAVEQRMRANEEAAAQLALEVEREHALIAGFSAWGNAELAKGRPAEELILGAYVIETGLLKFH